MRGLSGDFSTMPMKDLVAYLGNRRATGTLRVVRAEIRREIQLREGLVVSASSNQPHEYFGRLMVQAGHLSAAQLEKAFATQRQTRILLGKILVRTGLVTEDVVRTTLGMKFREALLDALPWASGEFTFDAEELPMKQDGVEVSIGLLELHREGEFRETAWQAIRAAFPSGKYRLVLNEQRLTEAPAAGSLDGRLMALIREGLTIDEMVSRMRMSSFILYQRLYALYRQEVVQRGEEVLDVTRRVAVRVPMEEEDAEPEVTDADFIGSESSTAEIILAAQNFLGNGDFREGEALARRAYELSPSPETMELLKSAEAALLGSLRQEYMDTPRVPSLLVPPAHLKTLQLSSPERYLLSRIDGRRDVASIVRMSPLQEMEALKYFRGFVGSGLVKLTPRSA